MCFDICTINIRVGCILFLPHVDFQESLCNLLDTKGKRNDFWGKHPQSELNKFKRTPKFAAANGRFNLWFSRTMAKKSELSDATLSCSSAGNINRLLSQGCQQIN